MTREEIRTALLDVVCERTGYPAEMLDLEADLEGDLGIDSIKRVEIAGTLTQTLLKDVPVDIEKVTASKTLADVIGALEEAVAEGAVADSPEGVSPFEAGPAEQERIGRFVLQSLSAPAITEQAGLAAGGAVVVLDDGHGTGEAVAAALTRRGEAVVRLAPADAPRDGEGAVALVAGLRADGHAPKALVHLVAPGQSAAGDAGVAPLLLLAQAMADDLEAAAAAGGAAVMSVARLDGACGVQDGPPEGGAAQGAAAGFVKSLAQEWPAVRCKAVDVGSAAPADAAAHVLAELTAGDGLVEVGWRDGQRTTPVLVPASLAERPDAELLEDGAVVLVTGGARGITAQVALALAQRHRPRLVLVGRTEPVAEDEGTAGLTDLAALRSWFIEARRRDARELTPALVEGDCRALLAAREIRATLDALQAAGAAVQYRACDVSDPEAFGALIDAVYAEHGRLDGVIHGAGVIEDKLVRDKALGSLERVMTAKAGAADTLARRLRPEGLRFLVLFSSVSGRFGNRGQADYAAASEILNKLAQDLDRRWPGRVVAVDWGPWRSGGMVSPEVEREFARRGVALIPPRTGCRMLLEELHRGRKGEAELVIGGVTGPDGSRAGAAALPLLAARTQTTPAPDGGVEVQRALAVAHDRYLDHHRVDGRAVLPFAVAMELMAETARLANPGAAVTGLRDIRLLHGVTVDDEAGADIRITAAAPGEGGDVPVTISAAQGARAQYRSIVELDRPATSGQPGPAALDGLAAFPMTVAEAYDELLFHGPAFRRITAITGMDDRGSSALLTPSTPAECVEDAAGGDWLLDPILLDAALQVQVIWARLYWDVTLLPAQIGGHHVAAGARAATGPIRHELRIRPASRAPLCHADHWFHAADGTLLATLTDVVGVGTRALNRLAAGAA
ncbi:SDR family NAD(P)-dependent oxidoreductase [Baekduia soli]|uniref:SDR family NAD(P)-dependent oxidoreductase n=1 Tax=Baekduia soli TaxID=496014 RepID=A0A5B8U667_9ACTN|nr:SDR family NAD(P)-dependent oxidoreductase [Baekduia soli]